MGSGEWGVGSGEWGVGSEGGEREGEMEREKEMRSAVTNGVK